MPKFISDFVEYLRWRLIRLQEDRIERRYRIETSVPEADYLKEVQSANREHAVPYEPIQLNIFRDMIQSLEQLIGHPRTYHFIDLGSGKGRALIYASEAGFDKCIGVEFSETLHDKALANLDAYSARSDHECKFSLFCMDAAEFVFPDNDTVLFMYNPFDIEVMNSVLDKIDQFARSNHNEMYILYRNPTCAKDFASHHLELVDSQKSFQIFRVSRQ